MSEFIPPAIEGAVSDIIRRVHVGELTPVQAGGNLAHLNFHPDIDRLTDVHLLHVIADLAPDLEISNGDPEELWGSIERAVAARSASMPQIDH